MDLRRVLTSDLVVEDSAENIKTKLTQNMTSIKAEFNALTAISNELQTLLIDADGA